MRPSFNWMLAFCTEVRRRIDMYTARELATLIWVCIRYEWLDAGIAGILLLVQVEKASSLHHIFL